MVCLIDLFTTRHKVVHNGGSPNFQGLLFNKRTAYMVQILQSLSYKVCSIIVPKFTTFGLFILNLGTSAIMDQTTCCYNVTTSEIGLFSEIFSFNTSKFAFYRINNSSVPLACVSQ